jgi:predicted nucleic acid-binding protein
VTVLVDASVWIEFLRGTGSPADTWIVQALTQGRPLAWTEPVMLELLVGATSADRASELRALVTRGPMARLAGLADWETAATLTRTARSAGRPVRSTIACLIAAVAIRTDIPVVTCDRDFTVLASVSPLQVLPLWALPGEGRPDA